MAEIIPSGVIQLPNFAELQYKLDRQKQSDEMAVARDLAQYKRQAGQIAPGAMPLVQSQFDAWQNAAKKYAADQSAASFAELNNAYDNYSQAHGYAKFLFDTVKERDSMYYKDPTKWNIKVDEYVNDSGNILNNQYSSLDELVTATSNIPSLSPAKKYEFGSAEEWATGTLDSWKNIYKDLDTEGIGKILPEQRDAWLKDTFNHQIVKDETSKMNAILSEAKRRGIFGDGPITNDDINRVKADEKLSAELLDSFYSRAKSNFDKSAGLTVVGQYQVNEDSARAARERGKASEATGVPKSYRNLTPIKPDKGTGFIYRIDNNAIKTADGGDIVAFGVVDGVETVAVIPQKTGFELKPEELNPVFRPATESDRANLKSEMLGAYESYIQKGGVSLPKAPEEQQKKQEQKPTTAKPEVLRKKYNY
jgi:hypothetical protein